MNRTKTPMARLLMAALFCIAATTAPAGCAHGADGNPPDSAAGLTEGTAPPEGPLAGGVALGYFQLVFEDDAVRVEKCAPIRGAEFDVTPYAEVIIKEFHYNGQERNWYITGGIRNISNFTGYDAWAVFHTLGGKYIANQDGFLWAMPPKFPQPTRCAFIAYAKEQPERMFPPGYESIRTIIIHQPEGVPKLAPVGFWIDAMLQPRKVPGVEDLAITPVDETTYGLTAYAWDHQSPPDDLLVWADCTGFNGQSNVPMFDDGMHGDGGAGDSIFGCTFSGNPDDGEYVITVYALDPEQKSGENDIRLWHEKAAPHVYDYEIEYATYFGAEGAEDAREVILYAGGSVLVGGQTASYNLYTSPGALQPDYGGDDPNLGHPGIYGGDCYLLHLNASGGAIIAATYFGGSKQERSVYGMGLDANGDIVITSTTRSPNMPTTGGCFQAGYGGGAADWFVAKISPDLEELRWCTYIGGTGDESPRGGLALDDKDDVIVVGGTDSPNFPTTPGVYQDELKGGRDAAVAMLKPDGSDLIFCTLIGGNDWDGLMGARLNMWGEIYIAGHTQSTDFPTTPNAPQSGNAGLSDCFITLLTADASQLVYSTCLGGSGNEFAEHRLLLAPDGAVLLTGATGSMNFPTTDNVFQPTPQDSNNGFLTRLSADGGTFDFSTYFGGNGTEYWLMPTIDAHGNIFIVGETGSNNLPVTPAAFQPVYGGGSSDGALAVFSPDGSDLLYCSYLGGSGAEIIRSLTLGPNGEVYLVGKTSSLNFPITPGAAQQPYGGGATDAFVVKLIPKQ